MMKEKLLEQSLAVRTRVLPEVRNVILDVPDLHDTVQKYHTNIIEWLKPVIDLTGFAVYPMNGITEGLNWWYNSECRDVRVEQGDYQWIKHTGDGGIHYMSVPSAMDGNNRPVPTDVPVALDLAYVGSTGPLQIPMTDNIEFAFYSLSKPFGVRNIRTGWFFVRGEDRKLEDLTHSAKYYNYFAHWVGETIIQNFGPFYIHERLKSEQIRVCESLDLTPSDSVWLATSTNPEYQKYRRKNNEARLCLTPLYNID